MYRAAWQLPDKIRLASPYIICAILVLCSILLILHGNRNFFGQIIYSNAGRFDPSPFLIVPLPRTPYDPERAAAYLLDKNAKIIHKWDLPFPAISATLLDNDHLLVLHFSGVLKTGIIGTCDELAEYDLTGKKVRSIKGYYFSHDFDLTPNGNIATIVFDEIDAKTKKSFSISEDSKGRAFSDRIIELDKNDQVAWEWRLIDHLSELDFNGKTVPTSEITHTNSIRYLKADPIHGKPSYLISIRHLSKIVIIDRETKRIVWQSPTGLFSFQHDATLLENGNVLAFNNGLRWGRVESQVIEINPRTNKAVWLYKGGDSLHFSAVYLGSAERLPNGNTMITNGPLGQVFEVDRDMNIVWNYIVPIQSQIKHVQTKAVWQGHGLFQARVYPHFKDHLTPKP